MRFILNLTRLEKHILSQVISTRDARKELCTCMPLIVIKFIGVHILSCVLAHVIRKTAELHARNYTCMCLASKFIGMHILSRVITNTLPARKLPKELY